MALPAICMCGVPAFEHGDGEVVVSCLHCREAMSDLIGVPRGRLLVMQTFDMTSPGRVAVVRSRVQVVQDYEPGNRDGSRGGVELDVRLLDDALAARRGRIEARRGRAGRR